MSNLYERPLALVPNPQQLALGDQAWQRRGNWRMFPFPHRHAWVLASDQKAARRLLERVPRLQQRRPEAYALSTLAGGAAAMAFDRQGLEHSRATLGQLQRLAQDGVVPEVEIHDWPDLTVRGVHLDLKYMMHRKEYLLRWLDDLASYKINTLLLEYEDKFPYRQHPVLRHPAAFTDKQLREFLARARSLGLRVVPLIQTLGHVEYILKHAEFAHLRKNGFHTECDTEHPESLSLIRSILDEVLAFHEEDDWFHIGGDECWHLHQLAPDIRARAYGDHMAKVLRHVVQAGKRPLLWDDMVRSLPPREFTSVLKRLPGQTILCYWQYDSTPRRAERGSALMSEEAIDCTKGFDQPRRWVEYRKAGFDVLGIPCHDWGPIVPYYARYTVRNTLEMTQNAVRYDGPGIINSHWACFRCPLPLQDYGIALTADRSWRMSNIPDVRDFDEAYCRLMLGLSDRTFLEALYQMDGMLEMPTNLGRGVHLPYFYYMDAVLHYPNGHADRTRYGPAVPPETVDYTKIVQRKLDLLANSPVRAASICGLQRIRDEGLAASRLLRSIRGEVRRSRGLFELVSWLAEFRQHGAERMLALSRAPKAVPRARLLARSRQLRAAQRSIYLRFMDPRDYPQEEASLFDGEEALLKRK